jgi:hypothetical protein
MGLAALVSAILGIFSILLNLIISPILGKNDLVVGITMMMAFVFIAGFSVALAVFLILFLEKNLKSAKIKSL